MICTLVIYYYRINLKGIKIIYDDLQVSKPDFATPSVHKLETHPIRTSVLVMPLDPFGLSSNASHLCPRAGVEVLVEGLVDPQKACWWLVVRQILQRKLPQT